MAWIRIWHRTQPCHPRIHVWHRTEAKRTAEGGGERAEPGLPQGDQPILPYEKDPRGVLGGHKCMDMRPCGMKAPLPTPSRREAPEGVNRGVLGYNLYAVALPDGVDILTIDGK